MLRALRRLAPVLAATIAAAVLPASAGAQQIEAPVAFDSAGKVRSLTPPLVARYGLTAPAWPVSGEFVEARLFATSGGGHVLVVQRPSGALERFALGDAEVGALRNDVDAAMSRSGAMPTEAQPTLISEPARTAFARNQMLLSVALYGPLLASLADDGQTGTALYLLGAGSSFFISLGISRELQVTRAQNHLATDGALRGYGATSALLYASGAEVGRRTYSAIGLAGALGGSILGYQRGKGLTDAEAEAATTLSTLAAATGFGVTAAAMGADADVRAPVGSMLGAGLVGYFVGPNYPRTAAYAVTRGDLQLLSLAAMLGTAVGFTVVIDENDFDERLAFGMMTAGLVGGAWVGDRSLVRRFDYSMSQATQVQLATLAGAAMGGAVAVLAEPGAKGVMAMLTGGAILGAMAGHGVADPERGVGAQPPRPRQETRRLRVDPAALALAVAGSPGRHAVVSLRF